MTHKFTECARRIGLQGLKLHSLRHSFGTFMIAIGYDVTVVMELLGHEDIKTTVIYAKANTRLLREAMRSFAEPGENGYKMVTEIRREKQKLLDGIIEAVNTEEKSG